MGLTEEQKKRIEDNRAVALARRQLKLGASSHSATFSQTGITYHSGTSHSGTSHSGTSHSGSSHSGTSQSGTSQSGTSHSGTHSSANSRSGTSSFSGPHSGTSSSGNGFHSGTLTPGSASGPIPFSSSATGELVAAGLNGSGNISHSTSSGALNGAAKISAGSFYSKPSSMGGSAESQKRAIEEKRLAALARKKQNLLPPIPTPGLPAKLNAGYIANPNSALGLPPPPGLQNIFTKVEPIRPFKGASSNVKATCTLVQKNRFKVVASYHERLIKLFKTMKTGQYNATARDWSFDLAEHDKLVRAAGDLKPEVELTPLPRWILETFRSPKVYNPSEISLEDIEPKILDNLMPFQREGIQYAISRGGRVLIADDMGLGKTIQALGLASYYRAAWPFLVVAPSSMRYSWESAILRWLPSLTAQDITTVATGKDFIGSGSVVIISYDLLSKKSSELMKKKFNLVIMDESHCIKNDKSVRTKAAEPLMRGSRYLILLTGTPALSRPMELYSQISALLPKLFKYSRDFGFRYCNGQLKKIGMREIYDFSGSSNMEELSLLLVESCMIRRLKSDVLQQLPSKQRCMVVLDPTKVDVTNKTIMEKELAAQRTNVTGMEKRGLLLEWYSATAQCKMAAVQDYVRDLVTGDAKFLLFCHHQVMMAGLAEVLESTKTGFIRIDGSTPSELRKTYVDRFQTSPSCQVALLSITAANSGITLTAASLVVFAEIYWNPGILTQAEDRAHRIGQTDSVTVQYLVAKGTADDQLWPMIQKKLDVLNQAGLTKDNFQDSESKVLMDKAQKTIEDFFTTENDKASDDMFDEEWELDLANLDESPLKKQKTQDS